MRLNSIAARVVCGFAVPALWALDNAQLDKILKSAVATKAVPGVVAVVANKDAILYRQSVNMGDNTIFAIASMTKPVTSVAAMQLVEKGRLRLDAPASTYVKELAGVQVLEAGKLRAPKSRITIRQLLTHTSGFAYEFMHKDIAAYASQGKTPSMMAGGDAFLKAPLVADPGATWEYGISTDWLGRVVEVVSGQSLDKYFQANIFEPLGMKDSSFIVPPTKQARVASVHQRKPDGSLEKLAEPPFKATGFFSGGGGLHSTADDYVKFSQAVLRGGELGGRRILKSETVALMGKNQIGDLTVRPFRSLVPQLARDNAVLPGNLDKFGLGFAINSKTIANGRGANTMVWAGIFNTYFWIDRVKGLCAVLMTQMSPGADEGPLKVIEDFNNAVYSTR